MPRRCVSAVKLSFQIMHLQGAACQVMHVGPEESVTMLCILCRLHQEMQALRVQKDIKHRIGEKLAAEQDNLFCKVTTQSWPSVLTCTDMAHRC